MHFLIKRGLYLCCSLWMIITLTFLLMKIVPGDPFQDEQSLPKEIHQALLHYYGLDQPIYIQYVHYFKQLLKGELGLSLVYKEKKVSHFIKDHFPTSALLGLEALFLAFAIGIPLGTLAAMKENKWQDHTITLITSLSLTIPSFILAALLQYSFALQLHLFPLARWESFKHTLLPAIALSALPMAFISRLLKANIIEVLQSDYVKTARAKGLSSSYILFHHVLRNAFLPILSYLGPLLANILTGSFVIEKIFSIPGLGYWFVSSVSSRDYSLIMGLTIFYSLILMIAVFLIDLTYSWLDPRIQNRVKCFRD